MEPQSVFQAETQAKTFSIELPPRLLQETDVCLALTPPRVSVGEDDAKFGMVDLAYHFIWPHVHFLGKNGLHWEKIYNL